MRFRHLHEINFALVSGRLIKKYLRTRGNGKKAVGFCIENVQYEHWGGEVVQFKNVIYCQAIGEIARLIWYTINVGERIFVEGKISWKPNAEDRPDRDGIPYGIQVVLVDDVIRMRGDDNRAELAAEGSVLPRYNRTKPSEPVIPVRPVGNYPVPDPAKFTKPEPPPTTGTTP